MTDASGSVGGAVPVGSFRARQRTLREDEIIRAASTLLRTEGCEGLNMDVLSRRVGISKATLYAHFSSKQTLIDRVLRRSLETLLSRAGDPRGEGRSLEGAARLLAGHLLAPDEPDGCVSFCCLKQVKCPFMAWQEADRYLTSVAGEGASVDSFGPGELMRALCSVVAARAIAEERPPTQSEIDDIVERVVGTVRN
jgi:AcrR family transcriptional regulator